MKLLYNKNTSIREKFFKAKINRKMAVSMFFVALVPLVLVGYLGYATSSNILEVNAIKNLENNVGRHALELSTQFNKYESNVTFLANTLPIQGIIRSIDNNMIDPIDGSIYQLWVDRMNDVFREISKSNSDFLQVRYLDENGQELCRVDTIGSEILIKSKEKLQNKADRYYFRDTIALKNGEIFISPLDLNREGSPPEIEIPFKPVIRYGTPVIDKITGDKRGILIINVKAEYFLSRFSDFSFESVDKLGEGNQRFLVDQDGYYFFHEDESKEWGSSRDLGTEENFKNYFSEKISSVVLSGKNGSITSEKDGYVLAYYPVFPDKTNKENFWVVVELVPIDIILAPVFSLRNNIFIITVFFSFITFFLSFIIAKSLSKPLIKLTSMAKALADGNLLARSRSKSNDELGVLSKAFNKMADSILESQSELETKVELKTSDLGKSKDSLEKQQLAILNILEDVKEEKQRADEQSHELKKFQLAVEKASDHIVITDIEGIILYANEAVEKITGFTKEETIGEKVGTKKLWGGLMELDFYKNFWNTIKIEKKVFSGELNNKRKNGQKYVAQANISPILDKEGEVIFFVGIERDITREKEIDRMKTEFISLASHQLRTPLSAMKWFLEMLLAGDVGKLTKEQREMLKDVDQSNERMIALVNGLLNISRIESGRIIIDPKPTDLSLLIKGILKELEQNIKEKNLNLVVSMSDKIGEVSVDQSLIREVYLNLMTNAIKYSKKNGEIMIMLSKDSKNIVFQITDDGLGIPEKDQASMFEKFHRASNAVKSETDGTGLGLYLTKAIVESSKGKIWFESEENKGTTFWFTLPLTGVVAQKGEVHLDGIKLDFDKKEVVEIKSDTKLEKNIVDKSEDKPEEISSNEVNTNIDSEENSPNIKVESLDEKKQEMKKTSQNDKKNSDSKIKTTTKSKKKPKSKSIKKVKKK